MKTTATIILLACLSGCATLDGKLQNRVTTTLACDRAFFASMYGPVGITSEIDARDLSEMPCAKAKAASAASSAK